MNFTICKIKIVEITRKFCIPDKYQGIAEFFIVQKFRREEFEHEQEITIEDEKIYMYLAMYRVLHYTGENVLAPEPICTSRIYGFLANERLATHFLLEESKNKKEGCNKGFYILIEQYVSTVSHSFKINIALSNVKI